MASIEVWDTGNEGRRYNESMGYSRSCPWAREPLLLATMRSESSLPGITGLTFKPDTPSVDASGTQVVYLALTD